MEMKKVTLNDRDYDRVIRALKCYRGQCYKNDDMLEMEEITSFLERMDNNPEENLQRYKVAQEIDVEKEIQKSQGTMVAGCKGNDCD
tara:strand:- start:454 stop:714 length:261 start_codon:yes stop_codon:yes gene_type:complete